MKEKPLNKNKWDDAKFYKRPTRKKPNTVGEWNWTLSKNGTNQHIKNRSTLSIN